MTSFKEPQYFAPHQIAHNGIWGQGGDLPQPGNGWYLRLFEKAGDVRYAGESSTSYTKAPRVTGCAERIHAFNPRARLVYLMRDPVERALSHYWYNVRGGMESRLPLDAMGEDEEYLAYGDYLRQLQPYFDRFGRDSVCLVTLEDLVAHPASALNGLFAWLGLAPLGRELSFDARNVGHTSMSQLRPVLHRFRHLQKHWRWRELRQRDHWLARLARLLAYRTVHREPGEDAAAREYLLPLCRAQVAALSAATRQDFSEWPTVSAGAPELVRGDAIALPQE
jgi:hypothetical protein